MAKYVKITKSHLLGVVSRLPYQIALRDTDRTYWVAISVLKYFFGGLWLDEHLDPDGPHAGPLRQIPENEEEQNKRAYRILGREPINWPGDLSSAIPWKRTFGLSFS